MDKDTRREGEFRGDGLDCKCSAYGECECGCGADWTTKKEWEQERKIAKLESTIAEMQKKIKNYEDNDVPDSCR